MEYDWNESEYGDARDDNLELPSSARAIRREHLPPFSEKIGEGAGGSERIAGIIEAITYHNEANGYSVIRLDVDGRTVTAVGTIPTPFVGERIELLGRWKEHPRYGRQFEGEVLSRGLPTSAESILRYLSSHAVRGVGPKTAKKIVDAFGADALDVLERDPERLTEVDGISLAKARLLRTEFRRIVGTRRLIEMLAEYGIEPEVAVRLHRRFPENAIERIEDDPYVLVEPSCGASWERVERLARDYGVKKNDPRRARAGVLCVLLEALENGDLYLPEEELVASVSERLLLGEGEVYRAIENALGVVFETMLGGERVVYLRASFVDEYAVAMSLKSLIVAKVKPPKNLDALLEIVAARREGGYSAEQLAAIRAAATTRLLIVTGGPGTGKTTAMRGMCDLFQLMGLSMVLAAPTGRAAKRLSEATGMEAMTLHRLLEYGRVEDTEQMSFACTQLDVDAVIVDEASMLDAQVAHGLLRAIGDRGRLVLVGDADQLPPVSAGHVLEQLLEANVAQRVHFTEIFRQARESRIVMTAHAVHRGEMVELEGCACLPPFSGTKKGQRSGAAVVNDMPAAYQSRRVTEPQRDGGEALAEPNEGFYNNCPHPPALGGAGTFPRFSAEKQGKASGDGSDLRFIACEGDEETVATVVRTVARLRRRYGDVQVLSPTRQGLCGVAMLNRFLQRELNPYSMSKPQIKVGDSVFRVGDRVMQVRNNYDLRWVGIGGGAGAGIFNGECGVIVSIDFTRKMVTVDYDDKVAIYDFEQLVDLELAFATTVHKSQGSEYDAVVLVLSRVPQALKTRSVLYTALTRAKKMLVIVGDEREFYEMVRRDRREGRYFGLCARLTSEEDRKTNVRL